MIKVGIFASRSNVDESSPLDNDSEGYQPKKQTTPATQTTPPITSQKQQSEEDGRSENAPHLPTPSTTTTTAASTTASTTTTTTAPLPIPPITPWFAALTTTRGRGFAKMMSDSRDEEEEEEEDDNSSLGYSDSDSASLGSDAYFRPQPGDDLARPYARFLFGPINPYQTAASSSSSPMLSCSPSTAYGSLTYSANSLSNSLRYSVESGLDSLNHSINNSSHGSSRLPPFWLGGPIQEDAETSIPYKGNNPKLQTGTPLLHEATALLPESHNKPKREKKRHRNSARHQARLQLYRLHMKQRESASREKAVSLVRGQPQEHISFKDPFWAILFLLQFIAVILCALRFGFGVAFFRGHHHSLTESISNYTDPGYSDAVGGSTRFLSSSNHSKNYSAFKVVETILTVFPTNDSIKHDLSAQDQDILQTDLSPPYPSTTEPFTIDFRNVLVIIFFAGFYACMLSYISFGFMLILARSLILIMLIFSILVALAWGIIGLTLDPYGIISVMGFAALLSTLGYTMYSWNRIPFAATNLYTALTAMRCTADITMMGLMSLVVAFGWCLLWSMAFVGVVNAFNHQDCDSKENCPAIHNHLAIYLLLLFSFYWTTMVIKNVVRVTVASAIGTWWFHPSEIGPVCTMAVVRPLLRSLTTSLGSICLGSLIISPAQGSLSLGRFCCCCLDGDASQESLTCIGHDGSTNGKPNPFLSFEPSSSFWGSVHVEEGAGVVNDARGTVDSPADTVGIYGRLCSLVHPCHRWVRACNRWAFSYVGMYGYSFVEAGDRALQLFETRGWVDIVEDSLIQNVLLMASVVIGGSTGVFAVVVEETDGYEITSFHQPIITAFVIGSVLGYALSNILLLGVVGSAVNTVLVCFAAGPFDFDKNHPRLSREMREVWSQQMWEPVPLPITADDTLQLPHHHRQQHQ